jgi:hypothetical protein
MSHDVRHVGRDRRDGARQHHLPADAQVLHDRQPLVDGREGGQVL